MANLACNYTLPDYYPEECKDIHSYKTKGVFLYDPKDIKVVDGRYEIKRVYGKFKRKPIFIPQSQFEQYGIKA